MIDHMMSDLIREGFICPECQKDLTCFELLQAHFEIEHATNNKSNDDKTRPFSCNFKHSFSFLGLFFIKFFLRGVGNHFWCLAVLNKAKSYIQNKDHSTNSSQNTQFNIVLDDYQEIGVYRSFTNEFKNHRDNTIGRYVIQTNKLLTTLDKLISHDVTLKDEFKRKRELASLSLKLRVPLINRFSLSTKNK
jgi:hypothetical protein